MGTTKYALVAAILEVATELAVLPGVLLSTTQAQEVLEVIHDAPPACIVMMHITCSTEHSHQVSTREIVNDVRDATVAIFFVHAVDLEPTVDTTVHVTTTAELTHTVTPIDISPELASLEVCGTCQGGVVIGVNATTASPFTRTPVWPSSNSGTPDCSLPSTHKDVE
ncbi:putative kinase-like protein TMKL1 [Hordeum vulgare]|nr:putative kinase-like protein TMKL1 [Hordeum vulgare]